MKNGYRWDRRIHMQNKPIEQIHEPAHFEGGRFVEGRTLKIYMDNDPINPRTAFDNFGHIVCFHPQYTLGDEGHGIKKADFDSWDEMEKYLIREKKAVITLPLYLYDHSGITIRTHPFNDRWDSCQVGFTYVTRAEILDNWLVKRLNRELRQKARSLLESELETYDDYLTGNVYGYVLEDDAGNVVDSCWGYFGDRAAEYIKSEVHMQFVKQVGTNSSSVKGVA
jgi:hypothetical protein